MPRRPRIIIPGLPHHITQRGNNRGLVFREPEDYATYCRLVNNSSERYSMSIIAYCLMPNHVHFIAIPFREDTLARTFNTLHMRYSQYFNDQKHRSGHLWQGRFFSCPLDETHLYRAIRYVERNPVRAGLVVNPWEYGWSSAASHAGARSSPIHLVRTELITSQSKWKDYLQRPDDPLDNEMRRRTHKGLPLGTTEFIQRLEGRFGVSLAPRDPGRPRRPP